MSGRAGPGPGIEFAYVREYQPGDDVRRIDWQLTARMDRAYVREAHDERGLDIWLVVDVSPSVDWGTAQSLKRSVAVELSAVAGQLLGHRGNRVGLVLFADKPSASFRLALDWRTWSASSDACATNRVAQRAAQLTWQVCCRCCLA